MSPVPVWSIPSPSVIVQELVSGVTSTVTVPLSRSKWAVTVLLLLTRIVSVGFVLTKSPVHSTNSHPASGVAVRVTSGFR